MTVFTFVYMRMIMLMSMGHVCVHACVRGYAHGCGDVYVYDRDYTYVNATVYVYVY